ncbi:MAG: di-heme enzyme [Kofleriaceae bacterium]|nr:di-heme enzyme [Kofleriaceae bacterium]
MRVLVVVALAACAAEPAAPFEDWTWELPRRFAPPTVPADNPMSIEKVELGRHLFYDTRLSTNGTQACASCHRQELAFTDGEVTSVGATGERGKHNAMSLVNAGYNSTHTWATNIAHLEAQALAPMFGTAPVELGLAGGEAALLARLRAEPTYQMLFPAAFPDDEDPFSVDTITRALASFERTIISGNSRFDAFVTGTASALDAAEQRGLALFESPRLGCTTCHGGFNLSAVVGDSVQFFNTGLYNLDGKGAYPAGDGGLYEITGDPAHMGRFKPPTLRNIAITAPYMHDGSVATLEDVIDIYARGGRGEGAASPLKSVFMTGFTLTAEERADLIAFLNALTDEELLRNSALSSPWR